MSDVRIRVVSDLHVGSRWGLMPPDCTYGGETWTQNDVQRWLWKAWLEILKMPKADILIVNGDVKNGTNPKEWGAGVKITEPDPETYLAERVLEPIVKHAHSWFLVIGTRYHEVTCEAIGRALGAKQWPDNKRSGLVLDLELTKPRRVLLNVAHHPESGSTLYRGTALDKTLLWSILAAQTGAAHPADIIIRSHYHQFAAMHSNEKTVIITPGWQLQTPYEVRKAYYRFQPQIGWVDIIIRKDEVYPLIDARVFRVPKAPVIKA